MTTGRSLLSKLPELALEAVMVVFAVLVALGVEGWSDERQMREFADRARAGVIAEMQANLDEFQETGPDLADLQARLLTTIQEEDLTNLNGSMTFNLPDYSSAAWSTAQSSPAAPYIDYDWVIDVSRAYETYELYSRISDQLISEMSGILGRTPDFEKLGAIFGRLAILTELHGQLQERLEALLADEAA